MHLINIKLVLHKISEVLEPVLSNSPDSLISNPNAFQFLNQSDSINLGQFRIRTFRQRVLLNNKEDIFKAEGGYTFFIPDEEGFKPSVRPTKIDHQVIDGHVIPNHVLFTAPTPNDRPYNTLANTDNFKKREMKVAVIDFTGFRLRGETIIKEFCVAYATARSLQVEFPILVDTSHIEISAECIFNSKAFRKFHRICRIMWNQKSKYVDDHMLIKMYDLLKYDVYVRDKKRAKFLIEHFKLDGNPFKLLTDLGYDPKSRIMKTTCRNHESRNSYCANNNVMDMAAWISKKLYESES
ncbi:hypothetical protein KQX54_014507 [Cotesia glomerata]|uniref:Uncharacterized protein n=1 Tax=Cotesia glomerata TaxID=32391 RepID=A0AAV7IQV3_COTGL|nr:hypothetical protein KQX54_014507 [Cotesia glomerata]